MTKNISSTTFFIIGVVIVTLILIYHTYQIWRFPAKYTSDLRNGVKDWWPFADFYRKWFASTIFLWLFRIAYAAVLLMLILLLSMLLLGTIGIFP
jgi:hypothetical protein